MIEFVLDASAVLADIHKEPGGEAVAAARAAAGISSVNYAEVLTKLIDDGIPPNEAEDIVEHQNFQVFDADRHRSILVGLLQEKTRRRGISLGDRYCLQLARELHRPVMTTDRRWKDLDLDVEVVLIR